MVEAECGLDLWDLFGNQGDDMGFPADAAGEGGRFMGDSLLAGAAATGLPAFAFECDERTAEEDVG
jgi:hypothetical protein